MCEKFMFDSMATSESNKTVDDICKFLETRLLDRDCIMRFRDNKVDGNVVKMMSDKQIEELGVFAIGDRMLLRRFCDSSEAHEAHTSSSDIDEPQKSNQAQTRSHELGNRRKRLLDLLKSATKQPEQRCQQRNHPRQYGRPKKTTRTLNMGLRLYTGKKHATGQRDAERIKSPLGDKDLIIIQVEKNINYTCLKDMLVDKFFLEGENALLGKHTEYNFEVVNSRNENVQDSLQCPFTVENYIEKKMIPGAIRLYLLCTYKSECKTEEIKEPRESTSTEEDDDDNWLPELSHPRAYQKASPSGEVLVRKSSLPNILNEYTDSQSGPSCSRSTRNRHIQYTDIIDITDSESEDNEETQMVIIASLQEDQRLDTTIEECLAKIHGKIQGHLPPNLVNVVRGRLLEGATRALLRKSFDPVKPLSIVFMDDMGLAEGAVDQGGPRREFFTLVFREIQQSNMFAGPENSKCIVPSKGAENKDQHFVCGTLMALALAHKCDGPHFFSSTMYEMISKRCDIHATIDDVNSTDIKKKLEKIGSSTASNINEAMEEASEFLEIAGCFMPVRTAEDRDKLVQAAIDFYVLHRVRHCLERFNKGLETLGVLETIREHTSVMKDLFCSTKHAITLQEIQDLFVPILTEPGSNERHQQNIALSYWRDYLLDINDGETEASLTDIMMFATGAEEVPVCGFEETPSINFIDGLFPTSNTCSCTLNLPLGNNDFCQFKESMDFAVLNSPGFGVA